MIRTPALLVLAGTFLAGAALAADQMEMTVTGDAAEKAPLETLPASPDLPPPDALPFSLDEGRSAMNQEMTPLTVAQAARRIGPTPLPLPGWPLIPRAPFVVHLRPLGLEAKEEEDIRARKHDVALAPPAPWLFQIKDDNNTVVHESTGDGFPAGALTWDGTQDNRFVWDPNRIYMSYFIVQSSPVVTYPGEAVRFSAVRYADADGTTILLGERIFQTGSAMLSAEGKMYVSDIARRLSRLSPSSATVTSWDFEMSESADLKDTRGVARRQVLKSAVEKELGWTIPADRFTLVASATEESSVRIRLPFNDDPADTLPISSEKFGELIADPMTDAVTLRQEKNVLYVDLRHDRLFQTGTTHLREEAFPYLNAAMAEARKTLAPLVHSTALAALDPGMAAPPPQKGASPVVVLRSYVQKTRDDKRDELTEDPRVSAARSKLLFSLFAREGLRVEETEIR